MTKTDISTLQKRITVCQEILDSNPDMWPGCKAGYRREITMAKNLILGKKRKSARGFK